MIDPRINSIAIAHVPKTQITTFINLNKFIRIHIFTQRRPIAWEPRDCRCIHLVNFVKITLGFGAQLLILLG